MKKIALCCFLLTLPVTLIAADRDVNHDGQVNQADVTALARMVAGLDQVDIRYDQNGDRTLTLDDVNLLLDAIPPQPSSGSNNLTPAAGQNSSASHLGGGIAFYALRQKATGQCVVVAGEQGISPGDTIFGVFPSFAEAQEQITSRCSQGAAAATPTNVPMGLPLSNDRLYRPDETITRGKWGTVKHLAEDLGFMKKVKEPGLEIADGFFVAPGHGGDSEILWSHDGSPVTLSGVATVIDCIDYCGRTGTIEFLIRGDGHDLWTSGLVRHNDTARPFSVSLNGVRELRLVATDGGNGVDEDWGGWLNLGVGEPGSQTPPSIQGNAHGKPQTVGGSPIVAVAKFDGDDSTRGIFLVKLENGNATLINGVKETPLDITPAPMAHNFFDAIDRPLGTAAQHGQILVGPIRKSGGKVHALLIVDTTTGKMGYQTGLDDRSSKRNLKKINGEPAQSMASSDGNYTLIMRREGSGKTVGAYLYHATTGQAALFQDIGDLSVNIGSTEISSLPPIQSGVSSIAIQSGSDATSHFLLIDQTGGAMHLVGGVSKKPTQLSVHTLPFNLVRSFPKNPTVASLQRFSTIPVTDRSGATESALIIDVGTGAMAMIEDLRDPSKTRLVGINRSIYDVLPKDVEQPRIIAGVPRVDKNASTNGAWLFDSATSEILFLNHLQDPDNLFIGKVVRRGSH